MVVELRYEVGRIIGDGNFAVVREGVDRWNAWIRCPDDINIDLILLLQEESRTLRTQADR